MPRFIARVGLEDPAHLAAVLRPRFGGVEVLDVELRRDARVLVLGLDAEEADAHAVDDAALVAGSATSRTAAAGRSSSRAPG